jgi:hypothetical protein
MRRNEKMPKPGTKEWDAEVEFYISASTAARQARAASLGFKNYDSYANVFRKAGIFISAPQSRREKFTKPVVIKEPSLVIFDSQIPFHDADFLNKLLELAMAWGIKQGISGGDFLNMTAFSQFFENPEDKVWRAEREVAVQVIQAMHSAVPKWLLVRGNHETFLIKQLAEQIGYEDILALIDKREGVTEGFTATDYYYCIVQFGGAKWRITHPRNISVIHGRVPTALCGKFHSNVASGHGHLAGMNPDYSGKYYAVDVGVTCDPDRLDYVALRDTTRPAQCRGALILMLGDDGKCHPYHIYPDYDWEALKRMYGGERNDS